MSLFIVDVEADGPAPGIYSMVCFGAVCITDRKITGTFYGKTEPLTDDWKPEALKVSGFTREEHESFDNPDDVMAEFQEWILKMNEGSRPTFASDNPAFDWQFINYYFWLCLNENPFGFSARRIGDFYAGLKRDFRSANDWKNMRKTKHTHNPVDDAMGNAEALLEILRKMDANEL
jgi:DNA polymerase III epsilon subunit-like protein